MSGEISSYQLLGTVVGSSMAARIVQLILLLADDPWGCLSGLSWTKNRRSALWWLFEVFQLCVAQLSCTLLLWAWSVLQTMCVQSNSVHLQKYHPREQVLKSVTKNVLFSLDLSLNRNYCVKITNLVAKKGYMFSYPFHDPKTNCCCL